MTIRFNITQFLSSFLYHTSFRELRQSELFSRTGPCQASVQQLTLNDGRCCAKFSQRIEIRQVYSHVRLLCGQQCEVLGLTRLIAFGDEF